MYKKIIMLMVLLFSCAHADALYSVRYTSVNKNIPDDVFLNQIPKKLKKETFFIKSGKYKVASYGLYKTLDQAKKQKKILNNLGYHGTYIRKQIFKSKTMKEKVIHRESVSLLISKINNEYEEHNLLSVIDYYEQLLRVNHSDLILKNLAFLYGKFGLYKKLNDINCSKIIKRKLLIPFFKGSYSTLNIKMQKKLKTFLIDDDNGEFNLIYALYLKKENRMDEAQKYFKKAYDLNPVKLNIIFGYAVSLDYSKKYEKALSFYQKIITKYKKNSSNYNSIYDRIQKIKGIEK